MHFRFDAPQFFDLSIYQVILAIVLDLFFGDPVEWPHLTKFVGKIAAIYEAFFVKHFGRTISSGLRFYLAVNATFVLGYCLIFWILVGIPMLSWLAWLFQIFVLYQTIAAMDLHQHVRRIWEALSVSDLPMARERLSKIVGRDTAALDESEISRATIESAAEGAVDGFVGVMFFAILGVPGAIIYRVTNTLDSIVGHRNEQYELFGKASARADDVLGWIPARLCGAIIASRQAFVSWQKIRIEAEQHASPNAGWSEAAMAYAVDVKLGGDNFYNGEKISTPIFNEKGRVPAPGDIPQALSCIWYVFIITAFLLIVALCICAWFHDLV
jgi:adenosylcobinamide-phosphate synthase